MSNAIIDRILKKADLPGLVDVLTGRLSQSELQSLLIEVCRQRAGGIDPARLLDSYKTNRFVRPSGIAPEKMLEFDLLAFSLLPESYEPIELSPVGPLGACSAVAPVSQNNILSTTRNTEVCSDSTNMMALECAVRREALLKVNRKDTKKIKLCSSHRLLRTQAFEGPATMSHFRLFSLSAAGRDEGSYAFERAVLDEQVRFFIKLLMNAGALDMNISRIRLVAKVADEAFTPGLKEMIDALSRDFPGLTAGIETMEKAQSYYRTLRYNLFATNVSGAEYFICDGGFTDWTARLLNNSKERYLISGFGTERLLTAF